MSRTDDLHIVIKERDVQKSQATTRCQENFSGAVALRSDNGRRGEEESEGAGSQQGQLS